MKIYDVRLNPPSFIELESMLNQFSKNGWELSFVDDRILIFKKEGSEEEVNKRIFTKLPDLPE